MRQTRQTVQQKCVVNELVVHRNWTTTYERSGSRNFRRNERAKLAAHERGVHGGRSTSSCGAVVVVVVDSEQESNQMCVNVFVSSDREFLPDFERDRLRAKRPFSPTSIILLDFRFFRRVWASHARNYLLGLTISSNSTTPKLNNAGRVARIVRSWTPSTVRRFTRTKFPR